MCKQIETINYSHPFLWMENEEADESRKMKIPFSRTIKKYIQLKQVGRLLKDWDFSSRRSEMLIAEYLDMKTNYLPINISGLTILDVGAGEGETALFYLAYGAKKVICVETNPQCFSNLERNSQRHEIIPALLPFSLDMLTSYKFDFMKMDIEGYEECLLDVELEKPSVIEVHGLQLRDRFAEKGYRISNRILSEGYYQSCSTSYAFWRC